MAKHILEYRDGGRPAWVQIEYRWSLGRSGRFSGPLTPLWLDLPQITRRDQRRFRHERLSDWLRTWAVGMFEVPVEGA